MQISPEQLAKVKKTLNVAAPTGKPTMGAAGKAAQGTRGPISDEGKQMTMGGQLNEVVKKAKPIATSEQEELEPVWVIGKNAYKIDDLVVQKKVLEDRFGKDSKIVKLVNNLISQKGSENFLKPDSRKLESGAVDTLQRQVTPYSPYTDVNKRGYKQKTRGGESIDEMGVFTTKKGKTAGNIFDLEYKGGNYEDTLASLEEFLKGRGVKPYRSLKNEQRY